MIPTSLPVLHPYQGCCFMELLWGSCNHQQVLVNSYVLHLSQGREWISSARWHSWGHLNAICFIRAQCGWTPRIFLRFDLCVPVIPNSLPTPVKPSIMSPCWADAYWWLTNNLTNPYLFSGLFPGCFVLFSMTIYPIKQQYNMWGASPDFGWGH